MNLEDAKDAKGLVTEACDSVWNLLGSGARKVVYLAWYALDPHSQRFSEERETCLDKEHQIHARRMSIGGLDYAQGHL